MVVVCERCGHPFDSDWNEYCPKCEWSGEDEGAPE